VESSEALRIQQDLEIAPVPLYLLGKDLNCWDSEAIWSTLLPAATAATLAACRQTPTLPQAETHTSDKHQKGRPDCLPQRRARF
jgi:hypothetical protein